MKLRIVRNSHRQKDERILYRLLNMINPFAVMKTKSTKSEIKNELDFTEEDYESIENYLHVDFFNQDQEGDRGHSAPIQLVIFIDKEPVFTARSIPVMVFSLDLLIEEKIEMIDASIVQENTISMMQGIVMRLNNDKNLLQEALKRHFNRENMNKNKKSPLW